MEERRRKNETAECREKERERERGKIGRKNEQEVSTKARQTDRFSTSWFLAAHDATESLQAVANNDTADVGTAKHTKSSLLVAAGIRDDHWP